MLLTLCSSSPVVNTTWIQADAPTSFSLNGTIGSTSLPFSWQAGALGNPDEISYTIVCSTDTSATDCINPGGTVVEQPGFARGAESGVIIGLNASTGYTCWVKAVNPAGANCSTGEVVTTAPPLLSEKVISYEEMISVTPSTYTLPAGASNLTYQAQCLSSSATVCDPQATGTGALQPATPLTSPAAISLSGLTNDVPYQCFSVFSYVSDSQTKYACSGPIEAKPFAPPTIDTVISGDQKLTITPSSYSPPNGGSSVNFQVQCLSSSATVCDPLATGTGALQPTPAQSFVSGIPVLGLSNTASYSCFAVVTYTLNSETKYTCSSGVAAMPSPNVPTLVPGQVIAGTQKLTITPSVYVPPAGASNVTYQAQCSQSSATVCTPSAASPSPALSSPAPIVLSNLQNSNIYSCFSVVSYVLNSSVTYTCSEVFKALPYTQPADLEPKQVVSLDQSMNVYVASYSGIPAQTNVQYQVQCLNSTATVCNPLATGSGALSPTTASSVDGYKQVAGLTTDTAYQCFSVVSYTLINIDSTPIGTRYTCSSPFEVIFAAVPTLQTKKVIAGISKVTITPDAYTPPSQVAGATVSYQVQCFDSASSYCDLVNDNASPATPLTSPGLIALTGLTNGKTEYCFSVVSYTYNSGVRYACSDAFQTRPFAMGTASTVKTNLGAVECDTTGLTSGQGYKIRGQVFNTNVISGSTTCDLFATGPTTNAPGAPYISQGTEYSGTSIVIIPQDQQAGYAPGTYKCLFIIESQLAGEKKWSCSDFSTNSVTYP